MTILASLAFVCSHFDGEQADTHASLLPVPLCEESIDDLLDLSSTRRGFGTVAKDRTKSDELDSEARKKKKAQEVEARKKLVRYIT